MQNVAKLQEYRERFIKRQDKLGADTHVIEFIANVMYHGVYNVFPDDSAETIRSLFEAGYCYYFALMLQNAFPGGKICLCYPFGHIVYTYNNIAFDICGVSDAEYEHLVDVSDLLYLMSDFRHVPNSDDTTEEFKRIVEQRVLAEQFISAAGYYELSKHAEGTSKLVSF